LQGAGKAQEDTMPLEYRIVVIGIVTIAVLLIDYVVNVRGGK